MIETLQCDILRYKYTECTNLIKATSPKTKPLNSRFGSKFLLTLLGQSIKSSWGGRLMGYGKVYNIPKYKI